MPYFQADDQLPQNQKVRQLLEPAIDGDLEGAAALSAWLLAGTQCQASRTDGQVARNDLVRHYLNPELAERLASRLVAVGLWHDAGHDCSQCPQVDDERGWVFHDWFQMRYDTGDQVKESRRKRQELKDEGMLNALWARDCIDPADPTTARCRYCRHIIKRQDRKSEHRPVPDHVDPMVAKGVRNLVLACKLCNQRKGRRTPAQAGMELLPPPRPTSDDPSSPLNVSRGRSRPSGSAERPAAASLDVSRGPSRPAAASTVTTSVSPPPGVAESLQGSEVDDEEAQQRQAADQGSDQIRDQSDPDLISAGLVRAHGRGRTAGSGRGSSSQGESHQGQAGVAATPPAGSSPPRRRRRGKRGKGQTSPQPAPPSQPPPTQPSDLVWDAGEIPVEDPPGRFGSPWHGWRGRSPAIDEAYCETHGQHEPCRVCQDDAS